MALGLPRLPLDLSTFRILREENYLYVDKTRHAYNLITEGRRFFLSRPRRFGKSLFVSMLREVLLGNRDLFQDLWIGKSNYSWHQHGVIAFNFSSFGISTLDTFRSDMYRFLENTAASYELNVVINRIESIGMALSVVAQALNKRFGRAAILIDEYDSPILRKLHDKEQAKAIRDTLRELFSTIKELDQYINFVFITGVSSFAKAGIFSGMNNLQILTMKEPYADICGYTDEEINNYLSPYLQAWSEKASLPFDEQRQKIKDWYNGYRFSNATTTVYNPFSVMHALHNQKLENFWFASGTPTFLIDELKKRQQDSPDMFDTIAQGDTIEVPHSSLGLFDVGSTPLPALMFQTGYLTIVDYDATQNNYQLGYPNQEVQQALQLYLLNIITTLDRETTENLAIKLSTALKKKDLVIAIQTIKQLFSHIPYQLYEKQEKYYHSILQMMFTVAGLSSHAEFCTNHGRIDMTIDLANTIYVIELKLNKSADKALNQIKEHKYYERFLGKNKTIILLGISVTHKSGKFDIKYKAVELS